MKLYNSYSQQKEEVTFLNPDTVKIYVCGITPYDTTHLGHAFLYVFFDAYIRYLRSKNLEVIYTQNVTDIDNDILKRAKQENRDWQELGQWWTDKFVTDLKELNVEMPTHYVKATDSIDKIIEITKSLVEKGFAYETDGWIYFSVEKFPKYGKLSHFSDQQMLLLSKERGGDPNDKRKKAPMDFVLWQKSAEGEPSWDSPWGKGRPGWHIECSAMINQYLGEQIDIHGGGRDLIYPHHESEIAQSETFTGKAPFVRYWMHTAMVMYQGEKMSKSLGNLVLVSDLLKTYSANAIRWMLLSHHYRRPWEYNEEELQEAEEIVKDIEALVAKQTEKHANIDQNNEYIKQFNAAMEDDANIPQALEIIRTLTSNGKKDSTQIHASTIHQLALILGFSF